MRIQCSSNVTLKFSSHSFCKLSCESGPGASGLNPSKSIDPHRLHDPNKLLGLDEAPGFPATLTTLPATLNQLISCLTTHTIIHNGLRQSPSSRQQTGTRLQSWLAPCPSLAKTTTRYLMSVAPKSPTYSAELAPPTKTSLQCSISPISELRSPVTTGLEGWPGACDCRHKHQVSRLLQYQIYPQEACTCLRKQ